MVRPEATQSVRMVEEVFTSTKMNRIAMAQALPPSHSLAAAQVMRDVKAMTTASEDEGA